MGVVLPLWAWYFLCSSVIISAYVVFMSVGEFITSEGVFCHCRRGLTFVGVLITSEGVVCLCGHGFSYVGVYLPS